MKYLSVCSGVEAASQAWGPLGWEPVAFSEIEPFPCAVLASRFPNVPNLGDMSKIHYDKEKRELTNGTVRLVCDGGIDLLVGGTPCQSFSVAGKRAGLEGASGLAYHYARLLGEIQPRWFVWENVPGALSSVTYGDQRDFNFLLHAFAVGGDASLGVRYDLCWRVLDTQHVRVESFPRAIPQRRRRVFVVGRLADGGGSGCEVLLEPEGVRGNPPPRRVKGQGFAADTATCAGRADGAEQRVRAFASPQDHDVERGHMSECAPTIGGAAGALQSEPGMKQQNYIAVGIDPYNGSATGAVSKTLNSAAATDADHTGAVAVGIGTKQMSLAAEEECSPTIGANDYKEPVAIGIGRDAFNSGANAKMAQSISEDVQPPLTAKGPGGVCVNGEPRKEMT